VPKDAPEVETELPDHQPQRRSGPWPLIIVVVVITLIAVWLVPGGDDEPKSTEAPPPSLLETPADATGTSDSPGNVEPTGTEAAIDDDRPGAQARALIAQMRASGTLSLDDLSDAANTALQAEQWTDAYLLYFFAAREGHAASALRLARHADPAHHTVGASLFEAPDMMQAHKWYDAAARQGDEAAQAGLADLRSRVEQLAADGDPEAQRIALLWQ
jgi:TPR repeat protein